MTDREQIATGIISGVIVDCEGTGYCVTLRVILDHKEGVFIVRSGRSNQLRQSFSCLPNEIELDIYTSIKNYETVSGIGCLPDKP